MGDQEGHALQGRCFSSVAFSRETETVDAVWNSSLWGIITLTDSKTLSGGQSNLYVVCMYQLSEKKKKEEVAVAEPSVTFNVIKICSPFLSFTTNV